MARISLKTMRSDIAEFRKKYENADLKIPEELDAYISDAEEILGKYPEPEGKARKILGDYCKDLGCELVVFGDDLEHGIPYYHKAIELRPNSYEIRWEYYTTLEELIEDEDIATPELIRDAIDCLQFYIDCCNTPELKLEQCIHLRYVDLGRVYLIANQPEKAAECARKSLEIEENNGAREILEEVEGRL